MQNNRVHYVTNNDTITVYVFIRREKKKTETNEFIKKESIFEILNISGGLFQMVAYHLVLIRYPPISFLNIPRCWNYIACGLPEWKNNNLFWLR